MSFSILGITSSSTESIIIFFLFMPDRLSTSITLGLLFSKRYKGYFVDFVIDSLIAGRDKS